MCLMFPGEHFVADATALTWEMKRMSVILLDESKLSGAKSDTRRESGRAYIDLRLHWDAYAENERRIEHAKAERHMLLRRFLRCLCRRLGDTPKHGCRKDVAKEMGVSADTAEKAIAAAQFACEAGLLLADDWNRVSAELAKAGIPRRVHLPGRSPISNCDVPMEQDVLNYRSIPTLRQLAEAWPAARDKMEFAPRLVYMARMNAMPSCRQITDAIRGARRGPPRVEIEWGELKAGPAAIACIKSLFRLAQGDEVDMAEQLQRLEAVEATGATTLTIKLRGALVCGTSEEPAEPVTAIVAEGQHQLAAVDPDSPSVGF
jgi:hypothetical protein